MAIAMRTAWEQATRTKPICSDVTGKDGLRRCLRLRDVVGFGLGCTVGGGIFVATGIAVSEAGPGVLLSFLLAASGCACTGLCYAEMSTLAPAAGSSYSFTYNAVGELAAFVVGIMNVLGNVLSGAAVARGWASYLNLLLIEVGFHPPKGFDMFPLGPFMVSPVGALLLILLGVVNCFGVKSTATANSAITAASIMLLLFFVVGSWSAVDVARWRPFLPNGLGGVFRGAGTVFFAYLGFDVLACLGEEAEDPAIVAHGIVWTLIVSTALYCATALTFTGLVTIGEVDIQAPLAGAAKLRGLDALALCVSVGAVGNTMTTVLGGILGAPRVCYVMAQDGLLPQFFAKVNKNGTPMRAIVITLVPTSICAGFLEFGDLTEIVSAGALCSFGLVCASLIVVRQKLAAEGEDALEAPCAESAEPADHNSSSPHKPAPDVVGQRRRRTDITTTGTAGEVAELSTDADDEDCADHEFGDAEIGFDGVEEAPSHDKLEAVEGEVEKPRQSAKRRPPDSKAKRSFRYGRFQDEVEDEDGEIAQLRQSVGQSAAQSAPVRSLGAFAFFCLTTGLTLRLPSTQLISGVQPCLILSSLSVLGAALAALKVIVSFRCSESRKTDTGQRRFRLPCMPLVPLAGIMMNMMLLSELPLEALWRTLVVVILSFAVYFGYAARRSHLNEPERVGLRGTQV